MVETLILSPRDASRRTDQLRVLQNFLLASEEKYPNIGSWFSKKVVPGISSGSRTACLGFSEGQPIAAAILKHGKSAKFCHLNISEKLQGQHLGELFFCFLLVQVLSKSESVHFTLPESLWTTQASFFRSFGFRHVGSCSKQYRRSEAELVCSADAVTLLKATTEKIAKLKSYFPQSSDNRPALVMSLKPRFAYKILKNSKTVEVRRRFSPKHTGRRIALYATAPVKAIVGEATIGAVLCDDPRSIWQSVSPEIGCSHSEFNAYVGGSGTIYAIELKDVQPYHSPIGLAQLNRLAKKSIRPPQAYAAITPGDDWSRAVSTSRLLHLVSTQLLQSRSLSTDPESVLTA